MRRTVIAVVLFTAVSAQAQFGDLLKKLDPSKIQKGAKVAQAATREFSDEEEADIGRVVAARILKTYSLTSNTAVQEYVTLVGNTVASYSSRPTLDWHFAVVDS